MVARYSPAHPLQLASRTRQATGRRNLFPAGLRIGARHLPASSAILHGKTSRALRASRNGQGASISEWGVMWWIMILAWPHVACMNNRRLNDALSSRLADALENRMKKPEIELRLCARRYMSHCPEG
jgi:hypothetical protein